MSLINTLYNHAHSVRRWLTGRPLKSRLRHFIMTPDERAADAATQTSDIAKIFYAHEGRVIHKWSPFFDVYERHMGPWRGKPVRMLEIGVSQGGSLEMWRKYFGDAAAIYGIDINPACAERVDAPNVVRIGSQDDAAFLNKVVDEMGGVDIVLDDGSHFSAHQSASFRALFPRLSEGGLYMIEDTHTAYWPNYDGGLRRRGTAMELVKELIDDMHGWYHGENTRSTAQHDIPAIHVYDSIYVLEKRRRTPPRHTTSPQ